MKKMKMINNFRNRKANLNHRFKEKDLKMKI